jgi:hypothetical protein
MLQQMELAHHFKFVYIKKYNMYIYMTLISDMYNVIFLLNSKCASTTLEYFLVNYSKILFLFCLEKEFNKATKNFYIKNFLDKDNDDIKIHNDYKFVEKMCNQLNKKYNNYFSFTIIRNPWDRMLSAYMYLKPDKNNKYIYDINYDRESAFYYNFNEWINNTYVTNAIINQFRINLNQIAFDEDGNQQVTKIYKLEEFNIQELYNDINEFNKNKNNNNFIEVTNDLNFNFNFNLLPRLNSTIHEHYSKYYSEQSIEIVAKIFKKDIEYGNYIFEKNEL